MDCQKMGSLIRAFRLQLGLTQKQLADRMNLSDKTVSKWERGLGAPDVSLLRELSAILGVSLRELLAGELTENDFVGGNMKNTKYYVCPVCGSITACTGNAAVSCCGRSLEPLEAKKADLEQQLLVEQVEDEWYIQASHPMEKEDYISFIAFATGDRLELVKQYPEWEIQTRIPRRGHGKLLWYSTSKGLFYQLI